MRDGECDGQSGAKMKVRDGEEGSGSAKFGESTAGIGCGELLHTHLHTLPVVSWRRQSSLGRVRGVGSELYETKRRT